MKHERDVISLASRSKADEETFLVLDWDEWETKNVSPRKMIVEPILQERDSMMIVGERGGGKTFLALGLACAMATGTNFLRWKIARPLRVLYVDGEMQFQAMQDRANAIMRGIGKRPAKGYLQLLSADMQECGLPDMAGEDGRFFHLIESTLGIGTERQMDVLIMDNLSALIQTGDESSGELWNIIKIWLLKLRRAGMTVIFLHHTGKGGQQRGTSKREDDLDITIKIEKPKGYKQSDGARFGVNFTKHRHFYGDDAEPFEVTYEGGIFTERACGKSRLELEDRILEMHRDEMSVRAIAAELGMDKSAVHRVLKKYADE